MHPKAKLTPEQVLEIRKRCDAGACRRSVLAKEFGVTYRVIRLVAMRHTYKEI
jgi:transposase